MAIHFTKKVSPIDFILVEKKSNLPNLKTNIFKKEVHEVQMVLKLHGTCIRNRDGNSSENFIPRGIEESRNDKFAFLGDRGI